jgi:hypothetical protein
VALGLAAEVHVDADVTAVMNVNMTVAMDLEDGERQVDIDGRVLVGAVLDLVRLVERFDTLADEDMEAAGRVADDL